MQSHLVGKNTIFVINSKSMEAIDPNIVRSETNLTTKEKVFL